MRVLVIYGSKRGGTEGIARAIGDELRGTGISVDVAPADTVPPLAGYDAVIVGGALYAFRWHRAARRFIARHVAELRRVPVWLFSSGPLDNSAATAPLPPPSQVALLMQRIGALDHVTFGGRLTADAKGFAASQMAKKLSGDWRDWDRIRSWAREIAAALPTSRPKIATAPPGYALSRMIAHGAVGTAITAAIVAGVGGARAPTWLAVVLAPVVFAGVARHYFLDRAARAPFATALVFAALLAGVELALHTTAVVTATTTGLWLPVVLVAIVTWTVGTILSMRPSPTASPTPAPDLRDLSTAAGEH